MVLCFTTPGRKYHFQLPCLLLKQAELPLLGLVAGLD